jgi:hypothetical protein
MSQLPHGAKALIKVTPFGLPQPVARVISLLGRTCPVTAAGNVVEVGRIARTQTDPADRRINEPQRSVAFTG